MVEKRASYITKHNYNFYSTVPWGINDVLSSYAFIFILAVLFFSAFIFTGQNAEMLTFAIVQLILSLATLGIVYIFIHKKYHLNFLESMGIDFSETPKYLSQGLTTSFFILLGTALITYLFTNYTATSDDSAYANLSIDKLRIISLFAVFFAPIVEEVFFRGFMQPAMSKYMGAAGGIIATALVFGFSHTQYYGSYVALVSVIFIGLVLGMARHISGSIMPGVFAHLINNLIAAIALLSMQ
ncbi:MAG: type II CAAX endopeptidase family protein [bacterium]